MLQIYILLLYETIKDFQHFNKALSETVNHTFIGATLEDFSLRKGGGASSIRIF